MTTTPKARVDMCDDCGKQHEATFSHVDRFDDKVGVWSVYCDVEAPDQAAYYLDSRIEGHEFDAGYVATFPARFTLPADVEPSDQERSDLVDAVVRLSTTPLELGEAEAEVEYAYVCIRSLGCSDDDLDDDHDKACRRANDAARREFYEDVLDDQVADLVERRSLRLSFSTALGRAGLVWVDRVVR